MTKNKDKGGNLTVLHKQNKNVPVLLAAFIVQCIVLSTMIDILENVMNGNLRMLLLAAIYALVVPITLLTLWKSGWLVAQGGMKAIVIISVFLDLVIAEAIAVAIITYGLLDYGGTGWAMIVVPVAIAAFFLWEKAAERLFGIRIRLFNPFKKGIA